MLHINKFLDKIRIEEKKHSKNFIMTLRDAQDLHTDITKLLIVLQEISTNQPKNEEINTVVVQSGNNW